MPFVCVRNVRAGALGSLLDEVTVRTAAAVVGGLDQEVPRQKGPASDIGSSAHTAARAGALGGRTPTSSLPYRRLPSRGKQGEQEALSIAEDTEQGEKAISVQPERTEGYRGGVGRARPRYRHALTCPAVVRAGVRRPVGVRWSEFESG
ncbi:hypothetical protein BV20DRAFT_962275 [Pilatotrama ljubarskyi]|nr:hypothetical protein BV20DRAFT_962275 [Pilatotrama ljubarskyi]